MVRVERKRVKEKMGKKKKKWKMEELVEKEVEKVKVGENDSVKDFVRRFGYK
jgi:predicted Holliday junction resolvase-like endonuclease